MTKMLNNIKWESVVGAKTNGVRANVRLTGVGPLVYGRRECSMVVGIAADGAWVASVKHHGNMPAVKVSGKFDSCEVAQRSIVAIAEQIAPIVNAATQGSDKPGALTSIG